MCKLIKDYIIKYRYEKKNYDKILNLFEDKLLYWENRLNSHEATSDLNYFLFTLVNSIDIDRFDTDNDVYYYIKACIENKAKYIERNIKKISKIEYFGYEEAFIQNIHDENWHTDFSNVELKCMLEKLNEREKMILYKRYYLQFTDAELAQELNISRQAVNKARKKALEKCEYQLYNYSIINISI